MDADTVVVIDATDEPIDPDAAEFDDADEGAREDGTPVTSLHGSELTALEDDDA